MQFIAAYENCHSVLAPGGYLREMPADNEAQDVLKDVGFDLEKRLGKGIGKLRALSYRHKVNHSWIWIIKVRCERIIFQFS